MSLQKNKSAKWWLISVCLVCVLGGLIVFITGVGPWDVPPQARRLPGLMAEAEALGLPMTAEDLRPNPPIPDNENAALLVVDIAAGMQNIDIDHGLLTEGDVTAPGYEDALEQLRDIGSSLDAIVSALETRPHWYIDKDWDEGIDIIFPEFAHLGQTVRYLSVRAVLSARSGQFESALKDIEACRQIAGHLSRGNSLISALVSSACDTRTSAAVNETASLAAGRSDALAELEEILLRTEHSVDPKNSFVLEFYYLLSMMRNVDRYGGNKFFIEAAKGDPFGSDFSTDKSIPLVRDGLPVRAAAQAVLARHLSFWIAIYEDLEKTEGPSRDFGPVMDEQGRIIEESNTLSAKVLLPMYASFSASVNSFLSADVKQSLNLALIRALRFRAAEGRSPTSLAEIDAEYPDPFNPGNLISAEFSEDEIRIWSFGRDLTDEGGNPAASGPGDIYAIWPHSRIREYKEAALAASP
jgi:hypothetical protein